MCCSLSSGCIVFLHRSKGFNAFSDQSIEIQGSIFRVFDNAVWHDAWRCIPSDLPTFLWKEFILTQFSITLVSQFAADTAGF